MDTFNRLESEVRSYCRSFPVVFTKAAGHTLIDEQGRKYIDFLAGAGVLNYGHNNPLLKDGLIDYLQRDGVTHSLDMATDAKRDFLQSFDSRILKPRNLDYKVMFPGPTGTNAVESALKLARSVTGRTNVVAFTNGFHGMTLGSLSLTGNSGKRAAAGIPLSHVTHMPFCGYLGTEMDTVGAIEKYIEDKSSGVEKPAAFIIETVQAEGGVNVANREWLERLAKVVRDCEALLIIDDIQVGCGRTGPFFSFELADIKPDIVCLSKSLSGFGLPMAVTLFRPELDQWEPGGHNGTFRGHNPAFVTAAAALEHYWANDGLTQKVKRDGRIIRDALLDLAETYDGEVRGRGMILGLAFDDAAIAGKISREAFRRGLIIETAGPNDEVVKALPPLTIDEHGLTKGLAILADSVAHVMKPKPDFGYPKSKSDDRRANAKS